MANDQVLIAELACEAVATPRRTTAGIVWRYHQAVLGLKFRQFLDRVAVFAHVGGGNYDVWRFVFVVLRLPGTESAGQRSVSQAQTDGGVLDRATISDHRFEPVDQLRFALEIKQLSCRDCHHFLQSWLEPLSPNRSHIAANHRFTQ